MSLMEKVKTFVMEKKFLVLGVVLAVFVTVGVFVGWQKYTHSQSPEYFITQLNAALVADDMAALATLVDFRAITEDVATHILAQPMPSKSSTPKQQQVPLLAEDIQRFFIESMKNKDNEAKNTAPENPLAPLSPLPADFAKQISGNFFLHARTSDGAITGVRFTHPRLDKEFTLHFYLSQKPDWQMVRLINVRDLVQTYIKEDASLEQSRQKANAIQRAKDQKRINTQFKMEECVAFIHTPTGQKTPNLTIRIRGQNAGPFIIRNMTFDTTIHAQIDNGELAFKQNINTAARINVGTTLEDSFTLELETEGKEAKILTESKKILCEAKVRFMTLDNGTMLYTADDETYMGKPLPKK